MSEAAKRHVEETLGPDDGSAAEDRSGLIAFRQRKRQALASSGSSKEDPEGDSCKSEEGASGGDNVDLAWSLEAGLAHISSEECGLGELVKTHGPPTLYEKKWRPEPFQALAKIIVYQQLAGAAAHTIWKRFTSLIVRSAGHDDAEVEVEGEDDDSRAKRLTPLVTCEAVLAVSEESMRSVGLSARKASYIRDLASSFKNGTFDSIREMEDDELRAKLVAIRGLGDWSVDMYLLFSAHRSDVFPVGDLAVCKGLQAHLGVTGKIDKAAMVKLAEKWRPFRSLASWYMYRIVNSAKGLPRKGKQAKVKGKAMSRSSGRGADTATPI